MKKKLPIVILLTAVVLVVYLFTSYSSESADYDEYDHISPRYTLLKNEDPYYVYFYKSDCPYCEDIEDEIKKFADNKNNTVYFVNTKQSKSDIIEYDWISLNSENDIEIGTSKDGENIEYYDGESEDKYLNCQELNEFGKIKRYKIVIADDDYLEKNRNAKKGYVYASLQTPEINYNDLYMGREPIIAGVPTLLKIEKSGVTEFYFDSVEIKPYLEEINDKK